MFWAVKDLLDVREEEDGGREFLVKWAGEQRKGVPWADSWEPEDFCNETAVREFDFKVGVLDGLQLSGLDVTPLVELTRKKVAGALKACKGREIACMHDLSLDFLAHESLCRAFMVLASRPRALPSVGAKKSKFDRASAAVLEVEDNPQQTMNTNDKALIRPKWLTNHVISLQAYWLAAALLLAQLRLH